MGRFRRHCNTPQAMANFKSRYEIPNNVATMLALEDAIRECPDNDTLRILVVVIVEGGVRFPLALLLRQVLAHYRLSPMQVSANFFRVVMGINALNKMLGTSLGLHYIHHLYSISRTKDALTYYLKTRDSRKKLVLELPNSALGDDDNFLVVTGIFKPRNEDGQGIGFHAPHRFGRPPTNVNQGHDFITPQVHITDINRALAFNEQGTHLAGRARVAQEGPVDLAPPIPDVPIRLTEEASTSSSSGYSPSPPVPEQEMNQPINLSNLLTLPGHGRGHGFVRGHEESQGHGRRATALLDHAEEEDSLDKELNAEITEQTTKDAAQIDEDVSNPGHKEVSGGNNNTATGNIPA
ncbi:hypothetical protein RHSIM_Rhsim06G0088600 [Rhododendron simsii]|uniref:Uncharacterized protein n=1 Tax=Rhododendron simsii TaxID=118357 RepID=A0A834GZ90_RHOSS|nr:hypothetical protein RHSIM_Rhsim06G0088600 [Rhododendron simsii]